MEFVQWANQCTKSFTNYLDAFNTSKIYMVYTKLFTFYIREN